MKIRILTALAIVSMGLWSCKKDQNGNNTPSSYPMSMHLTDATGPYDNIWIDIESVEVNTDANGADAGWVTLNTQAGIYDITQFTNGLDTLLASVTLSTNTVHQIRLHLGANNTIKYKGVTYPLETPSAQQSGLKLLVNYTIMPNDIILLDFDASKSIVMTGNGKFILKPVIHCSVIRQSGSIAGMVTPVTANPAAYAIMNGDSTGVYCNFDGSFMIRGLKAGTYTVAFVRPDPLPVKLVDQVMVEDGKVTNMGTITLP